MPFLIGLGQLVLGSLVKYGKAMFKFTLLVALIGALILATSHFVNAMTEIRNKLNTAIGGIDQDYTGLLGCIMQNLGFSDFLTSASAILVSGIIFWGYGCCIHSYV